MQFVVVVEQMIIVFVSVLVLLPFSVVAVMVMVVVFDGKSLGFGRSRW